MTSPHLDDEQLSAHLDGLAEADHVRSCPSCQSRLRELEAVAAAVGEAPPPPDRRRHEAVEAALAAWDAERQQAGRGGRRRQWALPRWAPVAAALLLLLAAIPVVVQLRGQQKDTDATALRRGVESQGQGGESAVNAGDLGDQSDVEALRQAVRQGLAPPGAAQPSRAPARASADSPSSSPPCATEVRQTYGRGLGALVYTASLRWNGIPAVLLAYRTAEPPGLANRAFVMSVQGCQLLVQQAFDAV